jgi:hypothetical protein
MAAIQPHQGWGIRTNRRHSLKRTMTRSPSVGASAISFCLVSFSGRLLGGSSGGPSRPSRNEARASLLRPWYLRIESGKYCRERYLAETHLSIAGKGDILIRDLIPPLRHGERCGGEPHLVELITGIPGIHPR